MKSDSRYPYTYANDYVRSLAGYKNGDTTLSRSEASKIRTGIAQAIGMDDMELAMKLSDYYQLNEDEISAKSAKDFIASRKNIG